MRASLVTTGSVAALTSQITAVQTYVDTTVTPNLVITGKTVPTAEQQGNVWAKLRSDGTLDGIFSWISASSNWFTPLPWTLGSVALFPAAASPAGWTLLSSTSAPALPTNIIVNNIAYVWRIFDGNGFTIPQGSSIAYRRYDQSL